MGVDRRSAQVAPYLIREKGVTVRQHPVRLNDIAIRVTVQLPAFD